MSTGYAIQNFGAFTIFVIFFVDAAAKAAILTNLYKPLVGSGLSCAGRFGWSPIGLVIESVAELPGFQELFRGC